jgi:membrane protease YdiL (CAAX protease family)
VLALTVGWTIVQLGLVLPVLNHSTGRRQDLSQFEDLQGDLGLLALLLVISWTLAAVGEELAYRGYVQTRMVDAPGRSRPSVALAVLVSSVLFGLAHTEQGLVGVVVTFLDGVFFSVLRWRLAAGLWASVLAHGINNTIGLVGFFLMGPVYGIW